MRPIRTSKSAASRVDSSYVRHRRRGALVLLTFLALAASIAWWVMHQTRGEAAIYSPGRVASVHAQWDTNCAECHDQNGHGGFLKHVSDSACLKCHKDVATVHSMHQSTMIAEVSLGGGSPMVLSSHCSECHVEHRGHEALLDRTESTCLQCHRDVAKFTKGTPVIQAQVTEFAIHAHPQFGRELTASKTASANPAAMRDPTPLIFSHKDHMGMNDIKPPEGQTSKCVVCHEPPAHVQQGIGIQPDQRYMQPVSFEKHCASCHSMQVVAGTGTPIPHEPLDAIRPLLASYAGRDGYFRQVLAAMSPEQQKATLSEKKETFGPPPLRKKTVVVVQVTPEEWAAQQAKPFWDGIRKWYLDDNNPVQGMEDVKTAIQAAPEFPPTMKTERVIEYFVVHDKSDKCAFCHKLSDDTAAVKWLKENAGPPLPESIILAYRSGTFSGHATTAPSGTAPATAPSAAPVVTLPTGITSRPRRWYVNSVFDHSAHRFDDKTQKAMGCLDCHAKAMGSEQMTDVLLPGIESCVRCHHPTNTTGPGAVSSCLACHPFYHDRSGEHAKPAPMTLSAMLAPSSGHQ